MKKLLKKNSNEKLQRNISLIINKKTTQRKLMKRTMIIIIHKVMMFSNLKLNTMYLKRKKLKNFLVIKIIII